MTTVAVANGQYFGGGMRVAPTADTSDGRFEVTVWSGYTLLDFALKSRRIYDGTHARSCPGRGRFPRASSRPKARRRCFWTWTGSSRDASLCAQSFSRAPSTSRVRLVWPTQSVTQPPRRCYNPPESHEFAHQLYWQCFRRHCT